MRGELGDDYVNTLRSVYKGRVPGGADLVTYWFEHAGTAIALGNTRRAGLLATQAIRGGANRTALLRILESGGIFMAWSDREWILNGASVRVSLIGFDNGTQQSRSLNGQPVTKINANLTSETDTTLALPLAENARICFIGASPHGRFDISHEMAQQMLALPLNVNGRPNSDVIRPVATGADLVRAARNVWTIDFGVDMLEEEACQYEAPFEHIRKIVYPMRKDNHRDVYRLKWWLYAEPQSGMRKRIQPLFRYIATPRVAKHRIFVWQEPLVLCNDGAVVITRDDDYFFGILHSVVHEIWARAQGTQLRDVESGFRYTPTSTFETFPFPWAPGQEPPPADPLVRDIAQIAAELVAKRDAWLKPVGATTVELSKRTLTNLYNKFPGWLSDLHHRLNDAVLAAYGWAASISDLEILDRLLALNYERATGQS